MLSPLDMMMPSAARRCASAAYAMRGASHGGILLFTPLPRLFCYARQQRVRAMKATILW